MKALLIRFYHSIRAKWLRYRYIDKFGMTPEEAIKEYGKYVVLIDKYYKTVKPEIKPLPEKILTEQERLFERQFEFNKLMIKRMESENEIPDNKI